MGQESKPLVSKGLGQMSMSRSHQEPWISNPHPGGQELHAQAQASGQASGPFTKSARPCLTVFHPSPPGDPIPDSNMEVKHRCGLILEKLTLFG